MKKILFASFLGLLILGGNSLMAQNTDRKNRVVEAEIMKLKHGTEGNYFIVDYELPFAGMMEIRIFNEKEELVWREQFINDPGTNKIRLKASAFKSGADYTIQLNYKRNEITRKVKIG